VKTPAGDEYTGEVDNEGYLEGRGIMVYLNGDFHEGLWSKGAPQGQGLRIFSNGNVYNGEWDSGDLHGLGSMKLEFGSYY